MNDIPVMGWQIAPKDNQRDDGNSDREETTYIDAKRGTGNYNYHREVMDDACKDDRKEY